MTATGTISLDWANGEDVFCVAQVGHVLDLEEKCGAGIFEIAERLEGSLNAAADGLLGGKARLNDVRETIRLGLIGGGKDPAHAMAIVRRHVDGRPLLESVLLAYHIIGAALRGVPGDEVGKAEAERAKREGDLSATTDASFAPPSSASAPP